MLHNGWFTRHTYYRIQSRCNCFTRLVYELLNSVPSAAIQIGISGITQTIYDAKAHFTSSKKKTREADKRQKWIDRQVPNERRASENIKIENGNSAYVLITIAWM